MIQDLVETSVLEKKTKENEKVGFRYFFEMVKFYMMA